MVVLSSSGSHSALEKHESHALQLSAARLGSYFWSLQRPSLVCGRRLFQKITIESSCGPLEEWFGRPRRDKKFTSVRKTLDAKSRHGKKVACLCALGVHRASYAAAAIQQRSTNCNLKTQRRRVCTETELPPTRPLQQLAADLRRRVPTRAPDSAAVR